MRQVKNTHITLDVLQGRLLNKRAELVAELRAQQNSGMPRLRVRDADQARVLHDRFVAERLNSLAYERLRQVEAAIARLNDGEYGRCVDCEQAISTRRLAAIPWAERCISCEEALGTSIPLHQELRPAA
jgi:DnaK suppressor protein